MNNKALLATTALILALSAVSCGKEDGESSVSIAYGEATRTTVTEESKQEKTTEKTTKAVSGTGTATETTTSEVSGTETTTTDTEETSSETTTSAESSDATTTTATVADTTVQAETTAQTTTVATTAEVTTESTAPAPEETTSNDDTNNNEDNTQPEETTTPEPTTEAPTEDNTFEFEFTVNNLLNDNAGLLAILGTPNYSGEAPGCTSNGNDVKIYQYDGLEIQCYIDGTTEYIFSIEITGDKYVTDRGIKTGCSRAELESAYGTGETSGNMTVYYTGNNEMSIEYEGDTVKSIFFYAPV